MSRNDGVYILKTSDGQHRVVYSMNIEDLYYCFIKENRFKDYNGMVSTRAIEYFGGCRITRDEEKAIKVAKAIENSQLGQYTEYGVVIISTNKTWRQLVQEAKILAPIELDYILKENPENRYKRNLEILMEYLKKE